MERSRPHRARRRALAALAILRRTLPAWLIALWLGPGMQPGSAAWRGTPPEDPPSRRLWVLQPPDAVVEYDTATFAPTRTLTVPSRVVDHPDYLNVNARGQMVWARPAGVFWAGDGVGPAADRMWFWDGRQAREWDAAGRTPDRGPGGTPASSEAVRQVLLSATGDALFWFENTFAYRSEPNPPQEGPRQSVRISARMWRSDLNGVEREAVVSLPADGWCPCSTGACSETCPAWEIWAPDGTVGNVFVLTRVTPGQLQTTYHASVVYRRVSGQAWRPVPLAQPLQRPMAASSAGDAFATAVLDSACCGWDNESSDQLLLLTGGRTSALYDEAATYGNGDYDVSIFPVDARFSPDGSSLAYSLLSTPIPPEGIRLSSGGKSNPDALARIREAAAAMPALTVVRIGNPAGRATVVPRSRLVGWLTNTELLVARDGLLAVCDRSGTLRKTTPIRVRTPADAFLR
jgi:hypothetical protein